MTLAYSDSDTPAGTSSARLTTSSSAFSMGALQRVAISLAVALLLAAASWWALTG